MSELKNISCTAKTGRIQLLATASTATLLAAVLCAGVAEAFDGDLGNPTVWIDLGGQLERVDGGQQPYAPPFTLISPTPAPYIPNSPLALQHPGRYSYGGEVKISVHPHGDDWVFNAAIRYGRSNNKKHAHQETKFGSFPLFPSYTFVPLPQKFSDTNTKNSESHLVLDFQAGKDVGLGQWGRHGYSMVEAGLRFAQFNSQSAAAIYARPDFQLSYANFGSLKLPVKYFTNFNGQAINQRSFSGIGPSLSWDASAVVGGNAEMGEISFDWGLNGALLFGRQKSEGNHKTIAYAYIQRYFNTHRPTDIPNSNGLGYSTTYRTNVPHERSRSVMVPNVGAFAGVSFRQGAAKVSFGYRADFFFGAVDDGVDVRHTVDRNFYGPFAKISVGLGG